MYEQKPSASPLIHCLWRAASRANATYDDPANEYWSLAFTRRADGSLAAEFFAPTTHPRHLEAYEGEAYWGVEFNAHVFISDGKKHDALHAHTSLPVRQGQFLCGGRWYDIPTYDHLEQFVETLQTDGVIVANEQILRALAGDDAGFSERSWQRHFKQVTGLTKAQIAQIRRARHAYYLLQQGYAPTAAAAQAGYADHSHMIRSFKLLRGETPARILAQYKKV